jgi:flagellum-specific ATP synthase
MNALQRLDQALASASKMPLTRTGGVVKELTPTCYRIVGLENSVKLGDHVEVEVADRVQLGEVIRIERDCVIAKPFDTAAPLGIGAIAWCRGALEIRPHKDWKGRVLDSLARPIDERGNLTQGDRAMPADRDPPNPLRRRRIQSPLKTGVRVIDLFTPLCAGQRIGVFSGSGVGKSTLLSMLSRPLAIETIVVALVGERGREVREFLEGMDANARETTATKVHRCADWPR